MKSVPLSVRVTADDAAFLGSLSLGEARTPSEKLRAILLAERRRQEARHHAHSREYFVELFSSSEKMLRLAESITKTKSDPVRKIIDRVTDLAGVIYAGPGGPNSTQEALTDYETPRRRFRPDERHPSDGADKLGARL
jgi:hypothetical protein